MRNKQNTKSLEPIASLPQPPARESSQNRKVGKFTATATITRVSPSGEDVEQCYNIPYEIRDTDECTLPEGHPMRHKCHRSTVCINTVGSYECG